MTQSTIFLSTPSARRATVGEVPFTYLVLEFLSTPSARRATGAIHGGETFQWNFYPRPPRGGRRNAVNSVINFFKISIHALREEGDRAFAEQFGGQLYFYPRPPRGGRHQLFRRCPQLCRISIHALREEGDASCPRKRPRPRNFYPRPPRGGRHCQFCEDYEWSKFLSTPSARRAT